MTFAAIDTHLLLRVAYTSLIAGVGVSLVFSLAIYGIVRSSDMHREQRRTAAAAYGVLGGIALTLSATLVVVGIVLLAHKS